MTTEFDEYHSQNETSTVLLEWVYDERIPVCIHRWLKVAAAELAAMRSLTNHWRDTYSEAQLQISRLQRLNKQLRELISTQNKYILELQHDSKERQRIENPQG